MNLITEVVYFTRDYINHPRGRTDARKAKIREALKQLTGKEIVISCSTCYIEALFTILKISKMATSNYELKKGVVLQVFGHPEYTCTNNTITDALGDYYVKNHPEKLIYFVRYPKPITRTVPVLAPIKEPEKKEVPVTDPQKLADNIAAEALQAGNEPPVIPVTKRVVKRGTGKSRR